ncbi:MAG TPA: cyclase family protein [archaeon]|nr:cyclase family protein [archaeon]
MSKLIDLSHKIEPSSKNPYAQYAGRVMIDTYQTYAVDGYLSHAIYMVDHTGTHVESSRHFKKGGVTIERSPLSDFYGRAALLNLTHKKGRVDIEPNDLRKAASARNVDLVDVRIVLIRTDWSRLWGTREYQSNERPSITVRAHEWLLRRGIKTIGVDMPVNERDRLGSNTSIRPSDPERWPAHCLMKKHDFYIVENLTNLDRISNRYFTYIGFPLNFGGAAASPIRAIAVVE